MSSPSPLPGAHLRIARPTDSIAVLRKFYIDGLGFEILSEFHDHDGFDGLMLGHASAGYHLEFTHQHGHSVGEAPTRDNLLVFYLPDEREWKEAVERMEAVGCKAVEAENPYWEVMGRTFEDADGWRIVLQNAGWSNEGARERFLGGSGK